MSEARKRKPILKAGKQGGYEDVGAQSRAELVPDNGSLPDNKGWLERWLGFSGKHADPTWREILTGMTMEFIGSWLVGLAVVLATWAATDTSQLQNGFLVGLAYAASLFVGMNWMHDHVVRRHLNGAVSFGYLFTNDIGLLGFVSYTIAQYLGGMLAGATVNGLLLGIANTAVGCGGRSTVPIPVVATSSLATVVCLELFGAGVIVFSLFYNEFCNTVTSKHEKNFKRATFLTAITVGVLVLITFQFQVFTFNNVPYWAGLFSGINAGAGDGNDCRDMKNLANLYNELSGTTPVYTGSVFGTRGGAWALYLFGPYAGGLIGAILFWAIFSLRVIGGGFLKERPEKMRRERYPIESNIEEVDNYVVHERQTPLARLTNPLLETK